jgi:hypothetical protein
MDGALVGGGSHNRPSWEYSQCFDWMLSGCELQPKAFNLRFISDLLVGTGLPLTTLSSHGANDFCNPSLLEWKIS